MDNTADVIYLSGLIFAAVELAKRAGLPTRLAGVFAVVASLPIAQLHGYNVARNFEQWPDYMLSGILAAFVTAGVYSTTKSAAERRRAVHRDASGKFMKAPPKT